MIMRAQVDDPVYKTSAACSIAELIHHQLSHLHLTQQVQKYLQDLQE